jgi:hypothetical protein
MSQYICVSLLDVTSYILAVNTFNFFSLPVWSDLETTVGTIWVAGMARDFFVT